MSSIHRLIPLVAVLIVAWHGIDPAVASTAIDDRRVETVRTETFSFEVQGNRLVGLLDIPAEPSPKSTILLVHGYGKTNVVEQNGYADLRSHFTSLGINVLVWDKPGCGRSEGVFDIDQSVLSSAEEVVAAAQALRRQGTPGSERIGLWGISRAGWIAPLAIQMEPTLAFWISVSGVDDKENARYLLSSNLPIEGRTTEQTERVVAAWQRSFDAVWQGGRYQDYLDAAAVWSEDPFVQYMGWATPASQAGFDAYQGRYARGELRVDTDSGLTVYVPDFANVLASLDLPVLALFGDRDTNVDWRKTAELYRETIGNNADAALSVRVFEGANHNIKQAATGGVREMSEQAGDTPYAEAYFQTMADWLVANQFGSRRK